MKIFKGIISIGRMSSVDASSNNKIVIEIRNEDFDKEVEIEMDAKTFALVITGLGFQECKTKIFEC